MLLALRETERKIEGCDNIVKKTDNAMYYIANKAGERLSSRCYKEISEFKNGLAIATLKGKCKISRVYIDGELRKQLEIYPKGVIDVNGNEILKPIYDKIHISSDIIRICLDDKWGYADFNGRIICKPCKSFIEKFEFGSARVFNGERWGVINLRNRFLIPEKYLYIGELRYGKRVAQNVMMRYGVIDNKDNILEPFEYDKMQLDEKNNQVILKNSKTGKTFIL